MQPLPARLVRAHREPLAADCQPTPSMPAPGPDLSQHTPMMAQYLRVTSFLNQAKAARPSVDRDSEPWRYWALHSSDDRRIRIHPGRVLRMGPSSFRVESDIHNGRP